MLWIYVATVILSATASVHCDDMKSPKRAEEYAFTTRKRQNTDATCTSTADVSEPSSDNRKGSKSFEIVKFTAQKTVRSQPLPLLTSSSSKGESLDDFFASTENIDLQFADRAHVEQIPNPTDELMETFRRLNADRRIEAGLPAVADNVMSTRIVGLTNPPMHCLGLVLHSITNVGIQVLKGNYDSGRPNQHRRYPGLPELQLTLLETTFEATGPAFLVRLFYKIMQHGDNNTGGRQEGVKTIGFTRIWAEPAARDGDADAAHVIFVNQARLESHIRVPSLLIRLLPMSKGSMEKRGSMTLLKAIGKDMVPAMERLTDAYMKWISLSL